MLFLSHSADSQPSGNGSIRVETKMHVEIQAGFQAVSNFSFVDGTEQIQYCKHLSPGSAWPYLMSANMLWWKLVSGEMTLERQEEFISELEFVRQRLTSSHEGLFCDIISNVMRTRLELLKGNQLAAIRHLKGYYSSVKKSFGQESVYEPFNLTSGLYFYLAAVAWDEYSLFRPLLILFDRGDKAKGIKYLQKAATSDDPIVATEANYFLMRIFFDLEKNKTAALPYATRLVDRYPGNFIYLYYYLQCKPPELMKEEIAVRKAKVLRTAQLSERQLAYFHLILQKL